MYPEQWTTDGMQSLVVYFNEALSPNFDFHVEGMKRDVAEKLPSCELRIDGPDILQQSRTEYLLIFEVDIALKTQRNDTDIFRHQTNKGLVAKALDHSVPWLKFSDSGTHVDCFEWSPVGTNDFKIKDDRINVSSLECTYEITLNTETY